MILDNHKNEVGQPKPFGNRRENNTGNTNDNHQYQFQTPRKSSNMKKADNNKDSSPLRFQILQDGIKENDHDLNENDPIDNNSGSGKDKEKKCPTETQKQKLLRLNTKKCIWKYHFKGYNF